YKYLDGKMKDNPKLSKYTITKSVSEEEKIELESEMKKLPSIYALLPAVPLLLVISSIAIPSVELDVFTANVLGLILTLIIEMFRTKQDKVQTIADHLKVLFKQMGQSFASVVTLIVAA